jgi:hypothetical protein
MPLLRSVLWLKDDRPWVFSPGPLHAHAPTSDCLAATVFSFGKFPGGSLGLGFSPQGPCTRTLRRRIDSCTCALVHLCDGGDAENNIRAWQSSSSSSSSPTSELLNIQQSLARQAAASPFKHILRSLYMIHCGLGLSMRCLASASASCESWLSPFS